MKAPYIIAVEHSNNFFLIGLKYITQHYFNRKGRDVHFIEMSRNIDADLIIISEEKVRTAKPCQIRQNSGKMITVLNEYGSRGNQRMVCVTEAGSFSPQDRAEVLLNLLARLYRGANDGSRFHRRCPCCSQSLIKVEKDVLRWLSLGQSPATMATRLDMSIQSISRYKRSAMLKLGFERNHELYQWLLRGGLEHEERILTWR